MIVKTNLDEIENYLRDASNLSGSCDKVLIPENVSELIECVKECYRNDIPYTISGGGTGLTGGRVPFEGVLISTEKLDRILDFDPSEHFVVVESGVVRKNLDEFVESNGFFVPPNPTETNSYIGGNIACNSSGSRTFKYGTIRDYTLALDVVLPDGELISLKRDENSRVRNTHFTLMLTDGRTIEFSMPSLPFINTSKNTAGYFLQRGMHTLDLFVGSEGTLGTIVRAKLKIVPLPEKVLGLVIFFRDLSSALNFIDETKREIRNHKNVEQSQLQISPRLIEFFDRNSLSLVLDDYPQIPKSAECAIWIEQEYTKEREESLLSIWMEHISHHTSFTDQTWVAMNDYEHRRFTEFRHLIPVRVFELVAKTNYHKIGSDVAVNDYVFSRYLSKLVKLLEDSHLQYFIWGHFGNSHLHLNLVPRNEKENELALKIYDDHILEAISLGGTYSAEHGTGKLKRKYLELMYGREVVEKMREIKLKFDPKNLLGRGTLFF
ncbi:MAG: FAD-binding oxidoreductase [Candidatus Kapaibacteriota bacterium]|jgi:D-lactate dehydrogenase (cytochrome)